MVLSASPAVCGSSLAVAVGVACDAQWPAASWTSNSTWLSTQSKRTIPIATAVGLWDCGRREWRSGVAVADGTRVAVTGRSTYVARTDSRRAVHVSTTPSEQMRAWHRVRLCPHFPAPSCSCATQKRAKTSRQVLAHVGTDPCTVAARLHV
jgi:hypothetical protein